MASVMEITQLCRLCLVKDQVNIPIFEEQGDIRQIFLKISACLPVKVSREDNLPKKICDGCSCKLEILYQFWNTSANSEKQLLKWLSQVGIEKTPTSDKITVASVKMQPHSINSDNVVLKQEVVDLGDSHGGDDDEDDDLNADDLNVSNDAQDYILQQQQLPYQPVTFEFQQEGFADGEATSSTAGPSATITSEVAEVAPKRKRRAAAMKALPPHIDSEEEDDVDLVETKIAKTEEQSDDSAGEDPEPTTFVGLPSTSTDNEQPGPSGVGKGAAEAPLYPHRETKLRKPKIATREVSSFKKGLYTLMYNKYKKKYNLKPCLILLGNIKNLDTKEFVPSKKLQRHLHRMNRNDSIRINSKHKIVCDKKSKDFTRLEVIKKKNVKFESKNCLTRKDGTKKVTECISKPNKVVFQKNYVISDDSDFENDIVVRNSGSSSGVVKNALIQKHLEKHLVVKKGCNDSEKTGGKCRGGDIPKKVRSEVRNIVSEQPAKPRHNTDNTDSIIEVTLVNTFSSTDEVEVQHNNKKNSVTKATTERRPSDVQEKQSDTGETQATNDKTLDIFGHSIVQQYKCTQCKESFNDAFKLKRHSMVHKMKSDEVEKKPSFSCYLCMRKFFERNALWGHMRTHSVKCSVYKCKVCNVEFKSSRELNAHRSVCATSKSSSNKNAAPTSSSEDSFESALKYRCNICKRKFADVLQMRRHKKLHNNKSSEGESSTAVTTSQRTVVLLDKILTTNANSKKIQNTTTTTSSIGNSFLEKTKHNTKQICEKDKKVVTSKKTCPEKETPAADAPVLPPNIFIPNPSVLLELKPKFKCCQQVFAERNELFLHLKQQSSLANGIVNCNPRYMCNICSDEFSERMAWFLHCKVKHKNLYAQKSNKSVVKIRKPRYACGTCYMRFDSVFKLNEHKLDKHMSVTSLQKASSNGSKVILNDLKTEFERLFCTGTTNQEDNCVNIDDDDDDYEGDIIVENNGSDISESESCKDDNQIQTEDGSNLVKSDEKNKNPSVKLTSDNKALTIPNLAPDLAPQKVTEIVTYRCDICDDVFEDSEAFLEHEAFHKEIEMPKKDDKQNSAPTGQSPNMPDLFEMAIREPEKKNPSKQVNSSGVSKQQNPPQQAAPVNHINIVVSLPNPLLNVGTNKSTPDKNVLNTIPAQNLTGLLITNFSPPNIEPPMLYPLQKQYSSKPTDSSNNCLNASNGSNNITEMNETVTGVAVQGLFANETSTPFFISDVASRADPCQLSKPTSKSTVELEQPKETGNIVSTIAKPNIQTNKYIHTSKNNTFGRCQPLILNKVPKTSKANTNIWTNKPLVQTSPSGSRRTVIFQIEKLASNDDHTKQNLSSTSNQPTTNQIHPKVVEQPINVDQAGNLNHQISPESNTKINKPVNADQVHSVNNAGISKFPHISTVLSLIDSKICDSATTNTPINSFNVGETVVLNGARNPQIKMKPVTPSSHLETTLRYGKSNQVKLANSKQKLKAVTKLIIQSTMLSNNLTDDVIVLSDDDTSDTVPTEKLQASPNETSQSIPPLAPLNQQSNVSLPNSQNVNYECDNNKETIPKAAPRIYVRKISELIDPQHQSRNTFGCGNQLSTQENQDKSRSIVTECDNSKDCVSVPASPVSEKESNPTSEEHSAISTVKLVPPLKCEECKQVFQKARSYRRHMRTVRLKFGCRKCDYHTCSRRCIKLHYESQHNISFLCLYCMWSSSSAENLALHSQIHKCLTCGFFAPNGNTHRCNKSNNRDLKQPSSTKEIEHETTNPNNTDTSCTTQKQLEPELPVLRDELSVLTNTDLSSEEKL